VKRLGLATATAATLLALATLAWLAASRAQAQANAPAAAASAAPAAPAVTTVPGMPPVVDALNLYSETGSGKFSAAVQGDLERIYVPNLRSNDVYVIDPSEMKVIDRFKVGIGPQHIVPSWDLRTLWVTNNAEGRTDGSLTPIDPKTGKPGKR
jgi:YVTN family beta-propeller protein